MLLDDFSELEKTRFDKIQRMRAEGTEPYPTRTTKNMTNAEAIRTFQAAEEKGESELPGVVLAGRIRAIRDMGKLCFAHIEDSSGKIQLFLRINELGPEKLAAFVRDFDLGDFVQASGTVTRTRRGEVTLMVHDFNMLAKALFPLPADKDQVVDGETIRHSVLTDPETRYRQRYVDLAVNPEVRDIFIARAKIVNSVRDYLDKLGYLEVETPILQPIYGGAAAKPFTTYHNQLHQQLFLRISFELYLKRLIVGGMDRVYEIGRDFRNEGVSFKHNPEFTQLELYEAYTDYNGMMRIAEEMVSKAAFALNGNYIIHFGDNEIDLTPPWKRLSIRQGLIDFAGIDINDYPDLLSMESLLKERKIDFKPGIPRGKLIGLLMEEYIEPRLIQPTFLCDYPRDISPLAKNVPGDPSTVERFEIFIGGVELGNAFTELNDPLEQEKRFTEMAKAYSKDDEEQHPLDVDYIRALAYGMPPTGGMGIGIDRLAMLLTGKNTLREVILFPHLRKIED